MKKNEDLLQDLDIQIKSNMETFIKMILDEAKTRMELKVKMQREINQQLNINRNLINMISALERDVSMLRGDFEKLKLLEG